LPRSSLRRIREMCALTVATLPRSRSGCSAGSEAPLSRADVPVGSTRARRPARPGSPVRRAWDRPRFQMDAPRRAMVGREGKRDPLNVTFNTKRDPYPKNRAPELPSLPPLKGHNLGRCRTRGLGCAGRAAARQAGRRLGRPGWRVARPANVGAARGRRPRRDRPGVRRRCPTGRADPVKGAQTGTTSVIDAD
jgi:hypothetical protein